MVTRKTKTANSKDIELNRWCIEMAMRWPVVHAPASYGNAAAAGLNQMYQQAMPARDVDADVIGRAVRIKSWVTTNS